MISKGKCVKQALRYSAARTGLILLTIGNHYNVCSALNFCSARGGVCTCVCARTYVCTYVYTHALAHPLCGSAGELTLHGIYSFSEVGAAETFFEISEFTFEIIFFS